MAEKPSVTVIWPGLAQMLQTINHSLLPAKLSKQLGKAGFSLDERPFEFQLIELFQQGELNGKDLPMATLRRPGHLSLCADPCYLHVDRDRLLIFPVEDLNLAQSRQLVDTLQPLFADMSGHLIIDDANHWSLILKQIPTLTFTALPVLKGKSMGAALPEGADKKSWLHLINEIQMQLFDHQVNHLRESAQQLPVNSLWFWGNAHWQPLMQYWQTLSGEHSLLKMLANVTETPFQTLSDWQPDFSGNGRHLLVLPELVLSPDEILSLNELLADYISPLWQALRLMKINELKLIVPEHGHYRWSCWDSWKFWA